MTVVGIIGAGKVGSQIARAAIANGYEVVIANSRGPETLKDLIDELGPSARAATAAGADEAGDFVVVAVPLKLVNDMPVEQLAGKIVLDTNNYMPWRDGHFPMIDSGEMTVHELRQKQLPTSKVAKAFTHIQAPRLFISSRPAGAPDRHALSVSSNFPEATEFVTRLYDQFGFDTRTLRNSSFSPAVYFVLVIIIAKEIVSNMFKIIRFVSPLSLAYQNKGSSDCSTAGDPYLHNVPRLIKSFIGTPSRSRTSSGTVIGFLNRVHSHDHRNKLVSIQIFAFIVE
ncbi:NADPH-dependent F420 reductase [Paenibacillus sp. NPDC056579]|uniref:NADPH-dependent F420 reductase n=1 Tax=Paenibacillus sp. NPDC056579 TaxID=3345871 RepID=UPI0036B15928